MHNSQDGVLVDPDSPTGNLNLLVDANPSDVCLGCHALGLGAVFGADPLAPPPLKGAGNFVFLLEDNLNDGHNGALHPIPGQAAGHSIVAPSQGVGADGTLLTSPGGSFPSSQLGCTSCHDPHGNQDFRLLNGIGNVQDGIHVFTAAAPVASGISIHFGSESPTSHTAYESGMSAWCGNCHGDFHASGNLVHPAGVAMSGTTVPRYNTYGGTSNIGGGVWTSAYLPEVPFEQVGNTTSQTEGALGGAQVSCVSCHRAVAGTSASRACMKMAWSPAPTRSRIRSLT